MNLIQKLKIRNKKEQFMPSIFAFIFNPYYFNRRAIYLGIKSHSNKLSGKMLDFGCGTKAYSELFNVDEHIGLDLEVNEGHNLPQNKIDVFYDGKKIPFSEDTFDSIYSSEVFEHVFNLDEILKDINRVHKKDGLMLITLPFVWREHEMPNDFGRYTSSGIKSVLLRNNYKIISHHKNPSHFLSLIQLASSFLHHNILPESNAIKFILAPITIFPLHLIGVILNIFLPKTRDLYISHTILARNTK